MNEAKIYVWKLSVDFATTTTVVLKFPNGRFVALDGWMTCSSNDCSFQNYCENLLIKYAWLEICASH